MTNEIPHGYEWPRFEDGALVQHRDRIMHMGRSKTVKAIYFPKPGLVVLALASADHDILHHLFDGETVKRPPVLDKDGQEIKVGDTGYGEDGKQWDVLAYRWHNAPHVVEAEHEGEVKQLKPEWLTHERPDSWERLEEDARSLVIYYWSCQGHDCCDCPAKIDGKTPRQRYGVGSCTRAMAVDILARAEKLAGVMGDE